MKKKLKKKYYNWSPLPHCTIFVSIVFQTHKFQKQFGPPLPIWRRPLNFGKITSMGYSCSNLTKAANAGPRGSSSPPPRPTTCRVRTLLEPGDPRVSWWIKWTTLYDCINVLPYYMLFFFNVMLFVTVLLCYWLELYL